MPRVNVDGRTIADFESFHDVFKDLMGFPDFYGRNMDAWIDCMTNLDDPSTRMTAIHGSATDPIVLHIEHADQLPSDVLVALNECSAVVNWRRVETGAPAILVLSYRRPPQLRLGDNELLGNVLDALDDLYDRRERSEVNLGRLLAATSAAMQDTTWQARLTEVEATLVGLLRSGLDPNELNRRALVATDDLRQRLADVVT